MGSRHIQIATHSPSLIINSPVIYTGNNSHKMICTPFTSLLFFTLLYTLLLAIPSRRDYQPSLKPRHLTTTSRYAPLTKLSLNSSANLIPPTSSLLPSYNTIVRPTNQRVQHVIEVHFNHVPRYLLLDTGSADTWMISTDFQCLNASYATVPLSNCNFGDPYTGPEIKQTRNETYFQVYGSGETLFGTFGYAEVTIASLTVQNQKVAIANRGYVLGDQVRSGVVGLAPRAVTRLFDNANTSTAPPNGTVTAYSPVFESMYSHTTYGQDQIAPLFSLALERGDGGGYIAFGGLPPVNFTHDFTFTPFEGMNYYGSHDAGRYYPIQPQGFNLNGLAEATEYTAIVDSGTAPNRLPEDIADRVNGAL